MQAKCPHCGYLHEVRWVEPGEFPDLEDPITGSLLFPCEACEALPWDEVEIPEAGSPIEPQRGWRMTEK